VTSNTADRWGQALAATPGLTRAPTPSGRLRSGSGLRGAGGYRGHVSSARGRSWVRDANTAGTGGDHALALLKESHDG
jgi:hypothetical protein